MRAAWSDLGPLLEPLSRCWAAWPLLSAALKQLPVGTAYAVWTGIGAAGTALLGIVMLGEPATAARLACVGFILCGVIGLRLAG